MIEDFQSFLDYRRITREYQVFADKREKYDPSDRESYNAALAKKGFVIDTTRPDLIPRKG